MCAIMRQALTVVYPLHTVQRFRCSLVPSVHSCVSSEIWNSPAAFLHASVKTFRLCITGLRLFTCDPGSVGEREHVRSNKLLCNGLSNLVKIIQPTASGCNGWESNSTRFSNVFPLTGIKKPLRSGQLPNGGNCCILVLTNSLENAIIIPR